jgi:cation diffusion facilitator family transporter
VDLRRKEQVGKASRITAQGVLFSAALAIFKGAAGYLGNSQALIADAVESLGDVLSSAIVWFGIRLSVRPPDDNHPYGHGKIEPMAAVLVSVLLIGAALGVFISSLHRLSKPASSPELFTLPVLLVVTLVKFGLAGRVSRLSRELSSMSLHGDALHHQSDAVTSLAALIGVSVAIIGGEGYESADSYAAMFASAVIAHGAYRILVPALHELSDRAPESGLDERAKEAARLVAGVIDLEKCFVRKMGLSYYIDLHVIVEGELSVREGHSIAHRVEEAIQDAVPEVAEVLVHIEPKR